MSAEQKESFIRSPESEWSGDDRPLGMPVSPRLYNVYVGSIVREKRVMRDERVRERRYEERSTYGVGEGKQFAIISNSRVSIGKTSR